MLKIDRQNSKFQSLQEVTLGEASITERYDLQAFICNSPEPFFRELGQDLFLIGQEILPSDDVGDRIDILAIDREGNAVIIELKRGKHKLQMFQAISYAGMVSQWPLDRFVQQLAPTARDDLEDFLETDIEEINQGQRTILVAEQFDYSMLIGTDWLTDKYGVEILCCRISVASESDTNNEFLVCSNIYPAPEIASHAVARGTGRSKRKLRWSDWQSALATIESPAVKGFYERQLAADRENYLRKRILHFRIEGKRRWFVAALKDRAYTWQHGRFDGDLDYWKCVLSDGASVKPVKRDTCIVFYLITEEDFQFFVRSANNELQQVQWLDHPAGEFEDDELD